MFCKLARIRCKQHVALPAPHLHKELEVDIVGLGCGPVLCFVTATGLKVDTL